MMIKIAFPRPREAKALLLAGATIRGNELDLPDTAMCKEEEGSYRVLFADGQSFVLRKSTMTDPPPPIEDHLKGMAP